MGGWNNKEAEKAYHKKYYAKNKRKILARNKKWRVANQDKITIWERNNRVLRKRMARFYYYKHRTERLKTAAKYRKKNREKILAYLKEWAIRHPKTKKRARSILLRHYYKMTLISLKIGLKSKIIGVFYAAKSSARRKASKRWSITIEAAATANEVVGSVFEVLFMEFAIRCSDTPKMM